MKILVTGGAGYVGSHCVRALCREKFNVVVYDNLALGHRAAVDPAASLIVAELADTKRLDQAFDEGKFDAVMHFAALAEVNESVRDPLRYYRNNVINTLGLLEVMRKHGVKTFVFSSTCAVYGTPPTVPITEDMPKNPINPYGRTKLAIEWALQDSATAWGLGATALRYFNAAGAAEDGSIGEDHTPESHLIPLVLNVAMGKAKHIKVFGDDYPTPDGTCVRDYIHVDDLASAHLMAIRLQPAGTFRCYNIGTGRGVSVKEVIESAREVTGVDIPAIDAPRRAGDPAELYADPSRAMAELEWQPWFTEIRPTIETAWNWHRSSPEGFGPE